MEETARNVLPEDTVPCRVAYQKRQWTDIGFGLINFLAYVAFLVTGLVVVSRSHARHVTLGDGTRGLSEYYIQDAATCCANTGNIGYVCEIYDLTQNNGGNRRLAAGNSKFDGDEGIFDAFTEAPEIIVGLLSIVLGVALLWTILLRFFAKPIVILVEAVKIALVIVIGVYQREMQTKVICFVGAGLMAAYVVWQWKTIMFAAKMITHSTIALKENPSVLVGSLAIKVLYAGNAALFVLYFAKSFDVVDVKDVDGVYCDFVYPQYVQRLSIFWGLSYLWTILLFGQMRLSVIATIVGSWHFHPEDKPSVFTALKNVAQSFGTLSVSSLIATVAEKVNRMMSEKAWTQWVTPTICFTWPLHCCMCIFGSCIHTFVKMLTSYAVVLHTFTGENFIGSARNSFKILSRHFQGGFVTEITSRSLFSIASYAFSFCVALITWVWIDGRFEAGTLLSNTQGYLWILYIIVLLFNVYYPVLGLYIMIIGNKYLREWEKAKMQRLATITTDDDNGDFYYADLWTQPTNHLWIPPLAATFVGCIAMMFFTFASSIFLDIITTLFLCFAIDKDNNVDLTGTEFETLVKEMPDYKGDVSSNRRDPEVPVAYAVAD